MNHSIYLLKQAWAGLSAKKGFLLTVVTTLGITLGALLCILTLAYVVIAKPLPYPEQERLFQVNSTLLDNKGESVVSAFTYPSIIHLYENQKLFSESALVHYGEGVISSLPSQPTVKTTFVTPEWFNLLGSRMAIGRPFEQSESKDTFNPVAILSFITWQEEFNGDANILDKTVTFNGTSYRIVGVLSREFIEPKLFDIGVNTNVFLPWDYNDALPDEREAWGQINNRRLFVGKIDSELTNSQVEQTLTTLVNTTWQENVVSDEFFKGWAIKIEMQSLKDAILGDSKNTVLLLLAGVFGLVLVACTNITNLFMSRAAEQQRQLAIQAAVGASKSHLFQTLFAQSGLVVFISVLVALAIASTGFWGLQQYLALRLPRVDELTINGVTLSSALFIALVLGAFFAKLSANMINYRALNITLQSSGKGTGIQVSKRVRQLLVISQVTIVTILVFINMGLLKDSLKIINHPIGFETDNISTLTLSVNAISDLSMEERKPLMIELKQKLMELSQVENVSQAMPPFPRFIDGRIVSQVIDSTDESVVVSTRAVDGRYFDVIQQPLIEGDLFSQTDLKDENRLMIVNDVYASKLSKNGSAVGSKIRIGEDLYTVKGVVKGVQMPTATEIPMRAYTLTPESETEFLIKLKPGATISREQAVETVQSVSAQLELVEMEGLTDQKTQLLFTQYTTAITSAVLAVLTFLLATVGLYGILNYATQMRRFELGTRIAIGAKRFDIIGLIVKDNAGAVGIGILISVVILLALSIGFSDALASYLNSQLITLFSSTLILVCVMALFTCYWSLRTIINYPAIRSLRGSQ